MRRLCQKRQRVCKKIKRNFSTIKAAKGTPEYEKQQKLQARINSLRQSLSSQRLAQAVDDFWKMADTEAVNKQLQGIIPTAEALTPPTMEHELNERAAVAKLFFQCHDGLQEDQIFQIRMEIIKNLIILCRRQEAPQTGKKRQYRWSGKNESKNALPTPSSLAKATHLVPDHESASRNTLYCPFCKCDEEAGPGKRNKLFSRVDALGRHVRVQHLEYLAPNEGLACPYQGCSTFLHGAMHFLNHTACGHGPKL